MKLNPVIGKKVVIVGGGPAGLCVAWQLSKLGHQVTILEKSKHLGGLSRTFEDNGFYFDFGPHNIHSHRQDIIAFLQKILGESLIPKKFKVKIYFNDQLVDYPIKGMNALTVLSWSQKIFAITDLILARIMMFLRTPKEDDSFKDWITHRFGKTLYKIYFGPYAEKVWKISAKEISSYVAKKRVPIISLTDYVRKLFKLEEKRFHQEYGPKIQSFYPKRGVGQIIDFFADELAKTDCRILTECKVAAIERNGQKVERVLYERNGQKEAISADMLISTIPLNELILLFSPAPDPAVIHAAKSLDFCAERLLFIKTRKANIFDVPLVYFQNPKLPFNRIYDVRVFSPDCVPQGKNALCVEFTCSKGDAVWNMTDKQLFDIAIAELESKGLLKRDEVEGYLSKQVAHAYPRFKIGFQEHLKLIFAFLSELTNTITLGRQGLFCYANVDEVLHMGFRVVDYVHSIDYKPLDYHALFDEFIS